MGYSMNILNFIDQKSLKASQFQTQIISRSSLHCLTQMNVEGRDTFLGEVRHFKSHPYLDLNLPEDLSIAWVQMPAGKELPRHYHPCASLLIVTSGVGVSTGDSEIEVKAGDIIYIPEWNLHGFKGLSDSGFRALSIQFQNDAIFSSEERPETSYFDREKIPLSQRELIKISRDSIKSLHEIEVQGVKENLGILKNFSEVEVLKSKLPDFFSAAWVHLAQDEVLNNHQHSTDSMIVMTQGEGLATGDITSEIDEGDVVYIPAGQTHGFQGAGEQGFWALSIQFNESSLYEDPLNPKVQFVENQKPLDKLNALNEECIQNFKKNLIFTSEVAHIINERERLELLKSCLQVMSDSFQRLMFSRMALSQKESYRKIFLEHFLDELGHDTDLRKERGESQKIWDPILEASTFWFFGKNFLIDDPERIVMIQMVLEKGASLFYGHFSEILADDQKSHHIEKHCDMDEGHDSLGVNLLEHESDRKIESLQSLLKESWSMLDLYLHRTAEIVLKGK